nr:DNA primase [Acidiferrobacterales bacterium]
HEEKTPSFTVSPAKQFYHCFGCGVHGTAIGFLMEYANLGFVEAIEELAESAGMEVPREQGGGGPKKDETSGQLLGLVDQASNWFQQQLRTHPDARKAIAYLKRRGLDGRICAHFGVGFAPDSWDGLLSALGDSDLRREQLFKAGLVIRKDNSEGRSGGRDMYDRFRGRVIFPIEDHRGRVVAFGGRVFGEGEPKYLNSPETPLFHKGAELYGLHRARRAIGGENKSIVVEGYMDVVSLAQFGVENSVATLGTATTRTHLQRLFRLAPEIVFCFDGDRAGRDAAWKAMQVALPEMQDGRQLGFLFLPDGEDPDSIVRNEGGDAFKTRVNEAMSLDQFMFDTLLAQVDMTRMDGKARLMSMAQPLVGQLPEGTLREMMRTKLSSLSGLSSEQMGPMPGKITQPRSRKRTQPLEGALSPLALAIAMLLQNPALANQISEPQLIDQLTLRGAEHFRTMISQIQSSPDMNTARLLESFRESGVHEYLQKLASYNTAIDEEVMTQHFNDTLHTIVAQQDEQRRLELLEKSRERGLNDQEELEFRELFDALKKAKNAH